jgi:hypothetical protein
VVQFAAAKSMYKLNSNWKIKTHINQNQSSSHPIGEPGGIET